MKWENQAFYSRNIFSLFSNFTFYLIDPVNGDEINHREKRNLFGYLSTLTHKKSLGAANLTTTYSAGIRYDATTNVLANNIKRRFLSYTTLGDIKESNSFAFIQEVTFRSVT